MSASIPTRLEAFGEGFFGGEPGGLALQGLRRLGGVREVGAGRAHGAPHPRQAEDRARHVRSRDAGRQLLGRETDLDCAKPRTMYLLGSKCLVS